MNTKSSYALVDNYNDILMYLDYNSETLFNDVKRNFGQKRYLLLRKYLTHSDISTQGKPTKKQQATLLDNEYRKKFILYYDSLEELSNVGKLPTAAQSNICLPDVFYQTLNIKTYEENNKQQCQINNSWKKYIPIDTLPNYDYDDFLKIQIYNKKNLYSQTTIDEIINFPFANFKDNENNQYFKIDRLTIAAHGLGTNNDLLLNYFRKLSFKGDVVNILFDVWDQKMFLFFERNEKYFELKSVIERLPISPPIWKEYSEEDKKTITLLLFSLNKTDDDINQIDEIFINNEKNNFNDSEINKVLHNYFKEYEKTINKILNSGQKPKYRWYQKKWREVLIKLDELAFSSKGYAFCAISGLKGQYAKLGRFFIASHIKPYSDCIAEEDYESAFNPHNGLILSANVDALFDQHLITVDVDNDGIILRKKAVNSISRIDNIIYKDKLNSQYLTDQRKKFLRLHKLRFDTK